jgi:hypothetical protein
MEERKAVTARVPRVRKLKKPTPCEGIRWSEVPLKALYSWGPGRKNPPTGLEKYRCKMWGWWSFTALPRSKRDPYDYPATSGHYCWIHLWKQIHDHTREHRAFTKWFKRQPEYQDWYGEKDE